MDPLPHGWVMLGRIPTKEPDEMSDVEALTALRNEVCAILTPRMNYILSIRWMTDYQGQARPRPGKYICRLVKNGDWDSPKEEWRFPRTAQAAQWMEERIIYLRKVLARSP